MVTPTVPVAAVNAVFVISELPVAVAVIVTALGQRTGRDRQRDGDVQVGRRRDRDRRGRHRRQARVTAEGQRDHDVHGLRTARRRRVRHDDVDGDACLTSNVRVVAVGRVDRDRRDRRAPPLP